MSNRSTNLEGALDSVQQAIEDVTLQAKTLLAATKRASRSASNGDLKTLRQVLPVLVEIADEANEAAVRASAAWAFKSEDDEERFFSSGQYQAELLASAKRAGVGLYEMEGFLAAFPSLIRILPKDRALTVDRKPLRQVRPSVVVRYLSELQGKPQRANPSRFLETLYAGYQLTSAAKGAKSRLVRLKDIYKTLTVLPAARKDYNEQEFARDIYLLDESGVSKTSDGSRMTLDVGATGSKSPTQLLRVVDRSGSPRTYYGVEFVPGKRS